MQNGTMEMPLPMVVQLEPPLAPPNSVFHVPFQARPLGQVLVDQWSVYVCPCNWPLAPRDLEWAQQWSLILTSRTRKPWTEAVAYGKHIKQR